MSYQDGKYWEKRQNLIYYQCFRIIIRCIGRNAKSIIDVGSGNSPYLEWFDWIHKKVSVDIKVPYQSEKVEGLQGDIHKLQFENRFDICTCGRVNQLIMNPSETSFGKIY